MQRPRQRSSPPLSPPFQFFGESGRPLVGVYIQQAPFVKNAIFGLNFKVLLEYSRRCNLVIWNPQALPNKMPKTVCRNSVWFAFYGTLKSAHLGPENVSFLLSFFLSFFLSLFLKTLQFPRFNSHSIRASSVKFGTHLPCIIPYGLLDQFLNSSKSKVEKRGFLES